MDHAAVVAELERRGTEQNRKVYRRHGASEPLFGVSYADLKALKKSIKVDQALAEMLWATGNHDARVLATMVADPNAITPDVLTSWASDLTNSVLSEALAGLVAQTAHARTLMERWTAAEDECLGTVGWSILARLAMEPRSDVTEAECERRLEEIAATIHARKNRVRYAMNGALIAIGLRGPALRSKALDAAARVGKVEVDHGETACQTPDAASYILKAAARKRA